MNAYITSNNNFLAHELRRRFFNEKPWSFCFNLALRTHGYESEILDDWQSSVFGSWSLTNLKAVAGHFWGLHKAYDEIGERGRAVAMKRLSNKLYAIEDACCAFSFLNLVVMEGVSDKLLYETVDFFICAKQNQLTPRTQNLILQGAQQYATKVVTPFWES